MKNLPLIYNALKSLKQLRKVNIIKVVFLNILLKNVLLCVGGYCKNEFGRSYLFVCVFTKTFLKIMTLIVNI